MEPQLLPPLILLVFANKQSNSKGHLRQLPVERENIQKALKNAEEEGLCEILTLSDANTDNLFETLQDDRYRDRIAVFHFGGHANSFELLLEKKSASGVGLVPMLGNQNALQLVFLNGCNTQLQAQALNDEGIPLVIGTFGAINDETAQLLATQFYEGLGQNMCIGRAWDEAVLRIDTENGGNLRDVGWQDEPELDRYPWERFLKKGADITLEWNLPAAAKNLLAALPKLDATIPLPAEPYRFLNRYEKENAAVFFGRNRYIYDLYQRLTGPTNAPVQLLSGQSGVGKSSLLEAGLGPRLEKEYRVIYLRRNPAKSLTTTLKEALQPQSASTDDALSNLWLNAKKAAGKPLICILDQVEEVFTRRLDASADGRKEVEDLASEVQKLFMKPGSASGEKQKDKLVLAFRKEFQPEIMKALQNRSLPFDPPILLEKLGFDEIVEVVKGLTSTPALLEKYHLKIEDGLPELVADELLKDDTGPISPMLQILLSKLWEDAKTEPANAPHFTKARFIKLQKDGLLLKDFFRQQMEKLHEWSLLHKNDAVTSGLALDLLNCHLSDQNTSKSVSAADLNNWYSHRTGDVLADLNKELKALFLLVDIDDEYQALMHDTIALDVRRKVRTSDFAGQKALRILEGKTDSHIRNPTIHFLDGTDLKFVLSGTNGMRRRKADEDKLVSASEQRRKKRRRRRVLVSGLLVLLAAVAIWFGSGFYRQIRINYLINQARNEAGADPTLALQTLSEVFEIEADNLAARQAFDEIYSENEFYEQTLSHEEAVRGVAISPEGGGAFQTIYTWTDSLLFKWNRATGQQTVYLVQPGLETVVLSPDGRFLAATTTDSGFVLIDAATLEPVGELAHPFDGEVAQFVIFHPGGLKVWAATSRHFYEFDARRFEKSTRDWPIDSGELTSLFFVDTSNVFILGFKDGSMEKRHPDGHLINTIKKPHTNRIVSIWVLPDESRAVSADFDGQIIFWQERNDEFLKIPASNRRIDAAAWSPDNSRGFFATADHHIKSYSLSGDALAEYKGHTGQVNALSVSADGQYFASASDDGLVRIWKTDSKIRWQADPHLGGVSGFFMNEKDSLLFIALKTERTPLGQTLKEKAASLRQKKKRHQPTDVCLWNMKTGTLMKGFQGHRGSIHALAGWPDGRHFATCGADSTVFVWPVADGNPLRVPTPDATTGSFISVAVSPDGKAMAALGANGKVVWWNQKGELLKLFSVNETPGNVHGKVVFSPKDPQKLLVCSYDSSAALFDLQGRRLIRFEHPNQKVIKSAAFSPDGNWLLLGEASDTVWLFGTTGSERPKAFQVDSERRTGIQSVCSISFSGDGKLVALGMNTGQTDIFSFLKEGTMQKRQSLLPPGQTGPALSLQFSDNGQQLRIGYGDGRVCCWQLDFFNN